MTERTAKTKQDPIPDDWDQEANQIERDIMHLRETIEKKLARVRWLREAAAHRRSVKP
jgi:hypothetical protein